jgi:hypothetical protein
MTQRVFFRQSTVPTVVAERGQSLATVDDNFDWPNRFEDSL